jgi:protein-tyrosine phosphatase
VLVMEVGHQRDLEERARTHRGRIHRIGRFGGFDVPDPFRQPRPAFEQALRLIERGVVDFEKAFWRPK